MNKFFFSRDIVIEFNVVVVSEYMTGFISNHNDANSNNIYCRHCQSHHNAIQCYFYFFSPFVSNKYCNNHYTIRNNRILLLKKINTLKEQNKKV